MLAHPNINAIPPAGAAALARLSSVIPVHAPTTERGISKTVKTKDEQGRLVIPGLRIAILTVH